MSDYTESEKRAARLALEKVLQSWDCNGPSGDFGLNLAAALAALAPAEPATLNTAECGATSPFGHPCTEKAGHMGHFSCLSLEGWTDSQCGPAAREPAKCEGFRCNGVAPWRGTGTHQNPTHCGLDPECTCKCGLPFSDPVHQPANKGGDECTTAQTAEKSATANGTGTPKPVTARTAPTSAERVEPDPLASKDHGVARAASMPEVARLRKEWWSPEEHKAEVSKRCFEEHHRVTKQWKSLFDAMCDRAYKAEARVREVEGELAATSEIADALQAKQAALRAALEEER